MRLILPPGSRALGKIDRYATGGGRPKIYFINVFIPAGTTSGDFTVTGEVRDDSRVWPVHTSLRVRAAPAVRIAQLPEDSLIVDARNAAINTFTVLNAGNTALDFSTSPLATPGLSTTVAPETFALAPGASQSIAITSRLEYPVTTLFEAPLHVTIEALHRDFVQRETVGFDVAFVPDRPDPGPLFARLEGEMVAGWFHENYYGRQQGPAGRISLAGDLTSHTRLELTGVDGQETAAGTHTGLGDRDYARVALNGVWGEVAGGLISPPSFGILEPAPMGRGGLAELARGSWRLATFHVRDAYGDFAREHTGVQARQPDGNWELGLLAQLNQITGSPEVHRIGGYVQRQWRIGRLAASTQLAAADADDNTTGFRPAGEQRLTWQNELVQFDGTYQFDSRDFALAGRSSRHSNFSLSRLADPWRWFTRGNSNRDTGDLLEEQQKLADSGRPVPPPHVLELTTHSTSLQRSVEAGVSRQTGWGEFAASLAGENYATETDPGYRYDSTYGKFAWSRSANDGYARVTLDIGTETQGGVGTDFAELTASLSGKVYSSLSYSANLRHAWNWNGFSTGFRRPGSYGQLSLVWQRHPRAWRGEFGADVYGYTGLPSSVRTYAQVEYPVGRRLNLGAEVTWENQGGPRSVWAFVRIPLQVPLPWRPVRGALTGRVSDGSGTAVRGAFADLNGSRALTDDDGRFVLPAMNPGSYPLHWRLPGGWSADPGWPQEVALRAGERSYLDLHAARLAGLKGGVTVRRSDEPEPRRLSGAVSVRDEQGRLFEAPVSAGEFQLRLPPGHYVVQFEGDVSDAVAAQLTASVSITDSGADATVQLQAVEVVRKMRRTVFPEDSP